MQWTEYIRAARHSWWIILLTAVVAVAAALLVSESRGTSYSAAATVAVIPNPDIEDPVEAFAVSQELSREDVATYGELVESPQHLERAAGQLGEDDALAEEYTASSIQSQEAFTTEIRVEGPDAELAADLATELSDVTAREYARLYPGFDAQIIEEPEVPTTPSGRSTAVNAVVGLILGLGVGGLIALARYFPTLSRRAPTAPGNDDRGDTPAP